MLYRWRPGGGYRRAGRPALGFRQQRIIGQAQLLPVRRFTLDRQLGYLTQRKERLLGGDIDPPPLQLRQPEHESHWTVHCCWCRRHISLQRRHQQLHVVVL